MQKVGCGGGHKPLTQLRLLQPHISNSTPHQCVPSACLYALQGPPKSADKLSAARKAVGFDRTSDGRVLLISDDGEPFQVKPDMGVPGALLLRWGCAATWSLQHHVHM